MASVANPTHRPLPNEGSSADLVRPGGAPGPDTNCVGRTARYLLSRSPFRATPTRKWTACALSSALQGVCLQARSSGRGCIRPTPAIRSRSASWPSVDVRRDQQGSHRAWGQVANQLARARVPSGTRTSAVIDKRPSPRAQFCVESCRGHTIGHIEPIFKCPSHRPVRCRWNCRRSRRQSPHDIGRVLCRQVNAVRVRAGSCPTPWPFGQPVPPVRLAGRECLSAPRGGRIRRDRRSEAARPALICR